MPTVRRSSSGVPPSVSGLPEDGAEVGVAKSIHITASPAPARPASCPRRPAGAVVLSSDDARVGTAEECAAMRTAMDNMPGPGQPGGRSPPPRPPPPSARAGGVDHAEAAGPSSATARPDRVDRARRLAVAGRATGHHQIRTERFWWWPVQLMGGSGLGSLDDFPTSTYSGASASASASTSATGPEVSSPFSS